jgi:hypothetical protein
MFQELGVVKKKFFRKIFSLGAACDKVFYSSLRVDTYNTTIYSG